MIHIKLSEAKAGMVLAEDVYGLNSVIYAAAGNALTERMISSLGRIGTNKLAIVEEEDYYFDHKDKLNNRLSENIIKDLSTVTDALKKFYDKNTDISEKIVNQIKDPLDNLVKCLTNSPSSLMKLKGLMEKNQAEIEHGVNVAMLSIMISNWSSDYSDNITDIALAGLLHDIGKIRVPTDILTKKNSLTVDEFNILKKHPHDGVKIIRSFENINDDILNGILHHHERLDGSGYPQKLTNEKIHIFGKIIGIADTYEALTSKSAYNKLTPYVACKILLKGSYSGKTDVKLTNEFVHNILELYIGAKVKLNNGQIGEIILNNRNILDRPLIKLNDTFLDLSKEEEYSIVEMVV